MATRTSRKPAGIKSIRSSPEFKNVFVYGPPGAGKTVMAGISPNALILNADPPDATESARVRGSDAEKWEMRNYDDLDESLAYFRHGGTEEYEWVWLDSVTLFQPKGMDQIMEAVVKGKPHRNLYVPDVKEYLENQNRLDAWVRHMTALPINFGMTAHVMLIEDEEEGTVTYMPAVQGGGKIPLSTKFCGYMSIVGRLHVVRQKGGEAAKDRLVRVLETEHNGKWYAKDRYDALGGRVVNPTIPSIVTAIDAAPVPSRRKPRKTATRRRTAG